MFWGIGIRIGFGVWDCLGIWESGDLGWFGSGGLVGPFGLVWFGNRDIIRMACSGLGGLGMVGFGWVGMCWVGWDGEGVWGNKTTGESNGIWDCGWMGREGMGGMGGMWDLGVFWFRGSMGRWFGRDWVWDGGFVNFGGNHRWVQGTVGDFGRVLQCGWDGGREDERDFGLGFLVWDRGGVFGDTGISDWFLWYVGGMQGGGGILGFVWGGVAEWDSGDGWEVRVGYCWGGGDMRLGCWDWEGTDGHVSWGGWDLGRGDVGPGIAYGRGGIVGWVVGMRMGDCWDGCGFGGWEWGLVVCWGGIFGNWGMGGMLGMVILGGMGLRESWIWGGVGIGSCNVGLGYWLSGDSIGRVDRDMGCSRSDFGGIRFGAVGGIREIVGGMWALGLFGGWVWDGIRDGCGMDGIEGLGGWSG
ncbi:hypothetical protein Tco_1008859 [Tanacetum coccineum]